MHMCLYVAATFLYHSNFYLSRCKQSWCLLVICMSPSLLHLLQVCITTTGHSIVFEQDLSLNMKLTNLARIAQKASEISLSFPPKCWDYGHVPQMFGFTWFGNQTWVLRLNLGPQAWVVSVLLTEPPLQLQHWSKWKVIFLPWQTSLGWRENFLPTDSHSRCDYFSLNCNMWLLALFTLVCHSEDKTFLWRKKKSWI